MFVGDEMLLDVSFNAAQARLANLTQDGTLRDASQDAYGEQIIGVVRIGPLGSAPGMSRLVEAHFRDLVIRENSAVLTLRWEAIGPGGGLFPALDADITLSPASDHATLLTLGGAYRPRRAPWAGGPTRRSCSGLPRQRSGPSSTASRMPSPVPQARPGEHEGRRERILHRCRQHPRGRRQPPRLAS